MAGRKRKASDDDNHRFESKYTMVTRKRIKETPTLTFSEFLHACKCGDLETVKLGIFLGMNDHIISASLYLACAYNNLDVLKYLLKNGFDVNERYVDGQTPLHIACKCGFLEIFRELMKMGADPTLTNDLGQTPFRVALVCHNVQTVRELITNYNVETESSFHMLESYNIAIVAKRLIRQKQQRLCGLLLFAQKQKDCILNCLPRDVLKNEIIPHFLWQEFREKKDNASNERKKESIL